MGRAAFRPRLSALSRLAADWTELGGPQKVWNDFQGSPLAGRAVETSVDDARGTRGPGSAARALCGDWGHLRTMSPVIEAHS